MARAYIAICETIRLHHRLAFVYERLPRVVEPYCHGISTAGFEVLRGFTAVWRLCADRMRSRRFSKRSLPLRHLSRPATAM
jgi:hypothetical protein